MNQIIIESMQWNTLKHIADVKPIDDGDAECLEEIRSVLAKHNCLNRFGVSLLHSHFDLEDDEILMEETDMTKREHWVHPVKRSFLEENSITAQTTVIGFDEKGYHQRCGCNPRSTGHHHLQAYKQTTNGTGAYPVPMISTVRGGLQNIGANK